MEKKTIWFNHNLFPFSRLFHTDFLHTFYFSFHQQYLKYCSRFLISAIKLYQMPRKVCIAECRSPACWSCKWALDTKWLSNREWETYEMTNKNKLQYLVWLIQSLVLISREKTSSQNQRLPSTAVQNLHNINFPVFKAPAPFIY